MAKRKVKPSKRLSPAQLARAREALAGKTRGGGRATAAGIEKAAASIGKGSGRLTAAQMRKAAAAARAHRTPRKKK